MQVILKANQSKPYTLTSFTFKFLYAVTSLDNLDKTWFQEILGTPEEAENLFEQFDPSYFPDRALLIKAELKDSFMRNYNAKQVEPVYIGRKGVPAFAWPGLERHDGNHVYLRGARSASALPHPPACSCADRIARSCHRVQALHGARPGAP